MNKNEKEKIKKVERLLQAIENVYPSTKELIIKSFLRGIFIGLGTTIGASIVIAILTFTISQLKLVPVIKQIINQTNIEQVLPENQ